MFFIAILAGVLLLAWYRWGRNVEDTSQPTNRYSPKRAKRDPFDDEFVAKMQEIAKTSGGTVEVHVPAGRRGHTDDFTIEETVPADLSWGKALVSAKVQIEGVHYGFHAIFHPRANQYTPNLYYFVTGHDRDSLRFMEFHLWAEGLRWTGLERPTNPLLVKSILRMWMKGERVRQAIASGEKDLPVPKKK
jgi:hypothetical protein